MQAKTKKVVIQFAPKTDYRPVTINAFACNITASGVLMIDSLEDNVLRTIMYPAGHWIEVNMENELSPEYTAQVIESANVADGQKIRKGYEKAQEN